MKRDSRSGRRGAYAVGAAPAVLLVLMLLLPQSALGVRVITYNILNFPGTTGSAREDDFRTVIEEIDPDVLVVQEMLSSSGVNQFLNNVMNYSSPGTYAAGPFVNGPDTDNALFYKVGVIDYISHQEIPTALRNISEYVLRPTGYSSSDAEFRVYSLHLKAGSTSSDQSKRLAEATILRNHLNDLPAGSHFMVAGDLNIRGSTEAAYQKFVGSESDNDGRTKDPINEPGYWHDNASFADIHTQSPRTESFGGGATGGMDDRFDQILISYALDDDDGLSYVPDSQVAYGNDGLHFNVAINYGTNYAVGDVIADALHEAADHLPLYAEFQVPAKVDAPAALAFGSHIVGSAATLPMNIGNVATAPADELTYDFTIPAGFSGPGGSFELDAGTNANHDITMDTGSAGVRSGTLTVNSNDVDSPEEDVSLSGTVLDHADPSLAASRGVLTDTLDFGTHAVGEFENQIAEVHNLGYSGLQALLEVYDAEIVGADGRFEIVGGFTTQKVGSTPAQYTVSFDDADAAEDSTYTAVLTFHNRDDSDVVGWADLNDLVVHLRATTEGGTAVPDQGDLRLALGPGRPNPFSDRVTLALSLPNEASVTARVHDVSGRLVQTIEAGELPAGTHRLAWNGKDESGSACASGIYFFRVHVNESVRAQKIVLLR